MEKHAEKLLNKAQKRLIMMPREENILLSSKQAIQVMEEALNELKEYILSYNFKDDDEEIRFFKQIKPQFLSLLLYHNKVYNLELIRPIESKEMQKQYLRSSSHRRVFLILSQMKNCLVFLKHVTNIHLIIVILNLQKFYRCHYQSCSDSSLAVVFVPRNCESWSERM